MKQAYIISRGMEELPAKVSQDFEAFYQHRASQGPEETLDPLVPPPGRHMAKLIGSWILGQPMIQGGFNSLEVPYPPGRKSG